MLLSLLLAAALASTRTGHLVELGGVWSKELRNRRDVLVYLPPSYDRTTRRYPVLYLQDGANVFDAATSFAGKEWSADETAEELAARGLETIVVAIDAAKGGPGGSERLSEYSPFPDTAHHATGLGERYARFVTDTVRPLVDRTFRTSHRPADTAVAGSSMGGLISLYIALRRPDVFGFAGAFSPSLWFAHEAILDWVKARPPGAAPRVYLDVGTREGASDEDARQQLEPTRRMADVLRQRGVDVALVVEEGAPHDETAWARRLPGALTWWLEARDRRTVAGKRVAVTFDDLPGPPGGLVSNDVAAVRENTRKLMAAFDAARVPVVAFVNESKLFVEGESATAAEERTGVLRLWLDAGHELGNHTYSHRSLNRTPLPEFEEEVVRGEAVTARLLAERGRRLRYFRHPFLQVGLELDKRRAFEAFLAGRGYTIAPVTIDSDEWIYAAVYADALRRGDAELAARTAADYVRYMGEVVAFDEGLAPVVVGREIPQVLLLHASALNGDHFAEIARLLKDRGYAFVTLEEALADPVWTRPDTYVGAWGVSWLHHWEVTAGGKRTPSPDPPPWVTKAQESLNPD